MGHTRVSIFICCAMSVPYVSICIVFAGECSQLVIRESIIRVLHNVFTSNPKSMWVGNEVTRCIWIHMKSEIWLVAWSDKGWLKQAASWQHSPNPLLLRRRWNVHACVYIYYSFTEIAYRILLITNSQYQGWPCTWRLIYIYTATLIQKKHVVNANNTKTVAHVAC